VHLEHPLDAVQNLMMQALKGLVPEMDWEKVNGVELHRWRFANVEQPLGAPFILDTSLKIGACGDWCLGNRVEAAFLSSQALGETLLDRLKEDTA